jgi:hypothetical protein
MSEEDKIKFKLSITQADDDAIYINAHFSEDYVACIKTRNSMNINELEAALDVFQKAVNHHVSKIIYDGVKK